jgi:DNA polymerase
LGYQSGAAKFKDTLWVDTYDDPDGAIEISDAEALNVVENYRSKYASIKATWRWLQKVWIPLLAGDTIMDPATKKAYVLPLAYSGVQLGVGEITGPTGLKLYYDGLRDEAGQWLFKYGGINNKKLYGGKLLENIIQFLARCAVMSAAVRLKKPLAGYDTRLTHTSHDEIVYLVPDMHVETVRQMVEAEMTRAPEWAAGLPLACEIGIAQNYGDAK